MPLLIREYEELATDMKGGSIAAGKEPAVASQSISAGDPSTEFSGRTYFLRLYAQEAVRLEFGESPSADANSTFYMSAGQTEFIGVKPSHKLDTAAG